jgi:hypothetical protein
MSTLKELLSGRTIPKAKTVLQMLYDMDEGDSEPFETHCMARLKRCYEILYIMDLEAKFNNEEALWKKAFARYIPMVSHESRVNILYIFGTMPVSINSFMHILLWGSLGYAAPILSEDMLETGNKYLRERQTKYLTELIKIVDMRARKENRRGRSEQDLALLNKREAEWLAKVNAYTKPLVMEWVTSTVTAVGKKLLLHIVRLFYCVVIPSFQLQGEDADRVTMNVVMGVQEKNLSVVYERARIDIPADKETDMTSDIPSLIRKDKDLYKIFQLKTSFPNIYASKDPLLMSYRDDLELACRIMRHFIVKAVDTSDLHFQFYLHIWAGITLAHRVIQNLQNISTMELNATELIRKVGAPQQNDDDDDESLMESKEVDPPGFEETSKPIGVSQMIKFYQPASPPVTPKKSSPSPSSSGSGSGSPSVVVPLPPNWINFRLGSPNLLSVKYDEGINACTPRDSDVDAKICYELRDAYKRRDLSPEEHTRARYKFAKRCVDSPCWDKGHCEAMRRSLSSSPTPPSPDVSALVDAYCTKANDNESMYGPYYSPLSTNRSPILDAMITNVPLFNDRFNTNNTKKDAKRKKKLASMYLDFAQSGEETPNRTKLLDLLGSPRRSSP